MSKLTYWQIYKMWKHDESLHDIPPEKLYRALKKNYIQAFLVKDAEGVERVWVYVPEENKMYEAIRQ